MKKYLGVKIVSAEPAWKELNQIDGTAIKLKSECPYFKGREDYYKVVYEDGYESWSPKEVFEKAYHCINNLTFGLAIEALKMGFKVAREGWNGKKMYLYLNKGCFDGDAFGFKPDDKIPTNHGSTIDGVRLSLFEHGDKDIVTRLPNIRMVTASGSIVEGWLASQTDILAEDWMIVEEESNKTIDKEVPSSCGCEDPGCNESDDSIWERLRLHLNGR